MKRDAKGSPVGNDRRLGLKKEVLRDLTPADLAVVNGGGKKQCRTTVLK